MIIFKDFFFSQTWFHNSNPLHKCIQNIGESAGVISKNKPALFTNEADHDGKLSLTWFTNKLTNIYTIYLYIHLVSLLYQWEKYTISFLPHLCSPHNLNTVSERSRPRCSSYWVTCSSFSWTLAWFLWSFPEHATQAFFFVFTRKFLCSEHLYRRIRLAACCCWKYPGLQWEADRLQIRKVLAVTELESSPIFAELGSLPRALLGFLLSNTIQLPYHDYSANWEQQPSICKLFSMNSEVNSSSSRQSTGSSTLSISLSGVPVKID